MRARTLKEDYSELRLELVAKNVHIRVCLCIEIQNTVLQNGLYDLFFLPSIIVFIS